jgi:putative ABC transport system permease protein
LLKNYLKTALRNLLRYKTYSIINIVGLAMGLTCAILILLWVQDELSFDRFQKNADTIYRVLVQYPDESGNLHTMPLLPSPLVKAAKAEIPEVIEAGRLEHWGDKKELIKYKDKVFYEEGITSYDPQILNMFSFPLVKGELKDLLTDRNDVVITEETAKKYFGDEDPIGKVLNWNNWQLYTVKGVLKDIPRNSHIRFNLLTRYENEEHGWPQGFTWSMFNRPIYLQLQKNANIQEVDWKLTALVKKNNERANVPGVKVFLQPLTDIHLTAGLTGEYANVRDMKYIYIYSIIALFILCIACINFINLSTARSAQRAKEVGLRKTIGANRLQVFKQYMSESFLLVCLSQAIALIFVELFLPIFNELSGKELAFNILDFKVLLGSLAIILITATLAGSYPALYLSGFSPISVLKGSMKAGAKSTVLRKGLVVTQFSLSIILILSTIIVVQQLHFLKNKDLGFRKENIVYLPIKDNVVRNYDLFKTRLLQNPNILSVAAKDIFPTGNIDQARVAKQGQDPEHGLVVAVVGVGYDYFNTLNLQLLEGRDFSPEHPTDTTDAIIVNEETVRQLGLTAPVGQKIRVFGGGDHTIIGVVKDAHFTSLHHKIEPQLYHILTDLTSNAVNLYGIILVKIDGQNPQGALTAINKVWNEVNPTFPLEINFLDQRYNQLYSSEQQISTIVNYFTCLAILISCLGLFGLASFTAEQRTKEIGVRKVLGASVAGVVAMLTKDFTRWVLLANIVAWPIAWFAMSKWLQNFAYHIDISWWMFALAGGLASSIALLTVGWQAIRAATANPVESLRYE